MVKKSNRIRHAYGLHRLRPSYSLFVSAKLYSHRMMRSDYFGHLSRIPGASRWHAAGETLEGHAGWRLRPRRVVTGGVDTPPPRAKVDSRRVSPNGGGTNPAPAGTT